MLQRTYSIGELSNHFQICRGTIFYYIKLGRIKSKKEFESGRWTYFLTEDQVLKLLSFVYKTGKGRRSNATKSKKRVDL